MSKDYDLVMARRSFSVFVLAILLTMAAALTLVHWHKDWSGQGCELCHVRQLPTLHSPIADAPAAPIDTEWKWHNEDTQYEPQVFSIIRASRAPPAFVFFTL